MKKTPEYIVIARILGTWGAQGKIKARIITDFEERFQPSALVYINGQPLTIESADWHKGGVILKLNTINTIEAAARLRGRDIEIRHEQLHSLPEGEYYLFQIIGLEVRTTAGECLGNVTEIETSPAHDIYVVGGRGEEYLIPAINEVIRAIDIEAGQMVIEPIEGLLSLNKKKTAGHNPAT